MNNSGLSRRIRCLGVNVILVSLLFVSCGDPNTQISTDSLSAPIINGDVVVEANSGVPLLEVGGGGHCTAELLSNQWASTAAHCLTTMGATHTLRMGAERATVDRFFAHPTLDVAVVHLTSPLTMNGSTGGYQRSLYTGDPTMLVGQDVSCFGYGNDAFATGFGTLRVGRPLRVARMHDAAHYEIEPNGRGQIPWKGDSGGLCVDAAGNMTGVQSTCYNPPSPDRFLGCHQVALSQDVRAFLKPVQFDFIKSCEAVAPDLSSPGDFVCAGEATTFRYGTKVTTLAKLKNIKSNHRFKVRLYGDGGLAFEQVSPLLPASSDGKGSSYFSVAVPETGSVSWTAVVLVDADDGRGFVEVGRQEFKIKSPYRWLNSEICSGVGAPDTCILPKRDFTEGDIVYGLVTIADVSADYRFSFEAWKDGVFQYDFTDSWRIVGTGVVNKDGFYPAYVPKAAGNWEYRFFIELNDGKGQRQIPRAGFMVYKPYYYEPSNLCRAIVADAWGNPVCDSPTRIFRSADNWYVLTKLTWLRKAVRVKYQLLREGIHNTETITRWETAGPGVLRRYFEWSGGSYAPGNWSINVFVEANDGRGFQLVDTLPFVIIP